jgi:fructokinase
MSKKILGIGNAIVDVFVRVDDNFLSENKLVKGSMKLIEKNKFESLKSTIKVEKI